jgi:methylenetetrahydrofolate dehydrogenase (NADP+)/methenyltetrahydrofolate cyclohydrolase
MEAKIIKGKEIAEKINKKTAKEVLDLTNKHGIPPHIKTIIIGDNKASSLYLKLRDRQCKKAGIYSSHLEYPTTIKESKIIQDIEDLNNNKEIHGILLQLPLPKKLSPNRIIEKINPKKDVEGFTPYNMGRTLIGEELIVPCTPLAVLKIIEHENIALKGLDITVINHSTVVGKPLSAIFLNRNATVNICHVFTKDLKKYTSKADILATATGVANIIKKEHIKNGAFVIDVGIIKSDKGVCGDVDFKSVKNVAGKITPVPGGVGPVTVACSLHNMLKTYKNCVKEKK